MSFTTHGGQSLFCRRKARRTITTDTAEKIHVVYVKPSALKPSEYNPRTFSEKDYHDLKTSVERFGLPSPIIANRAPKRKNIVIGGHFRLKVAKDLNLPEVPVVYVNIPDLKKEQELNLRLNNNLGKNDLDLLANIDQDILVSVGFDSATLDKIFEVEQFEDAFDLEHALKQPATARIGPGDIFQLGPHRLMCGDSTDPAQIAKLMDGTKAHMVFTDPPYNVDYKGRGEKTSNGIMNDKMPEEQFVAFCEKWVLAMKENLATGGVYYLCAGYSCFSTFVYALRTHGLYFSQPIIWVKNAPSMGWNDYRYQHEMVIKGTKKQAKKAQPILYGWNAGKHYFSDMRFEADVWEIKRRATQTMVHPTQKPVELVIKAIENSSKREQAVLDLFGGSGTTLVAAEKTGRTAYLNEMDPRYASIILDRWERLTGKKAEKV